MSEPPLVGYLASSSAVHELPRRSSRRSSRGGGFRCPYCDSDASPVRREQVSSGGWVVFVVLLIFCFPLCFIGLFMKDEYRVCRDCGIKLG